MAFSIRYDYFKYQGILFALFNVSTSLQNYINKIVAKKFDVFIII